MVVEILFSLFVALGAPIAAVWLAYGLYKMISKVLDTKRRELHPEYFKLFDEAMYISNETHDTCKYKTTYFEYKLKLIYKGLREGECTVEYFQKYLDRINEEYIEFAAWFEAKNKEAKDLFRKADYYAKRHGLAWGVLY